MTKRSASRVQTGPSGLTLTEILISIMILAIGLVSLAALFPIGMLRLREAQRSSRAAILAQSSAADVLSRGFLERNTFIDPTISPWYSNLNVDRSYDPWIQDTPGAFGDWAADGAYRGLGGMGANDDNQVSLNGYNAVPGPGLPVVYDPLWWYQQRTQPYKGNAFGEARFGDATPTPLGMTNSAYGLQRLTNIPAFLFDGTGPIPYRATEILTAFVSPEDVLWQDVKGTSYPDFSGAAPYVMSPSPVIPDLSIAALDNGGTLAGLSPQAALTNDWRYTWMFTGQRADAYGDKVFTGNVVIFENRPFGVETLTNTKTGDTVTQVAGERSLRAIFGYGKRVAPIGTMVASGTEVGHAVGSDNAVLLLWPVGMPDPEIRPGGWIADVTYERHESLARTNFLVDSYAKVGSPPAQRCYWYQVRRASPPADSADFPGMRYTLVQTSQKLQAKTLLYADGSIVHDNVALVSPHVIAVVPKTFSIP